MNYCEIGYLEYWCESYHVYPSIHPSIFKSLSKVEAWGQPKTFLIIMMCLEARVEM